VCDLPAKVTEFQDNSPRIKEEILRFDIPVTYTISVDICQWTEQLIHVELGREDEGKRTAYKNVELQHGMTLDVLQLGLQRCIKLSAHNVTILVNNYRVDI